MTVAVSILPEQQLAVLNAAYRKAVARKRLRLTLATAVFFAALIAQMLVFVLFATTNIGYLWYNFIGCAAVLILAPILQQTLFRSAEASAGV